MEQDFVSLRSCLLPGGGRDLLPIEREEPAHAGGDILIDVGRRTDIVDRQGRAMARACEHDQGVQEFTISPGSGIWSYRDRLGILGLAAE
jgi:hypothetical protein